MLANVPHTLLSISDTQSNLISLTVLGGKYPDLVLGSEAPSASGPCIP